MFSDIFMVVGFGLHDVLNTFSRRNQKVFVIFLAGKRKRELWNTAEDEGCFGAGSYGATSNIGGVQVAANRGSETVSILFFFRSFYPSTNPTYTQALFRHLSIEVVRSPRIRVFNLTRSTPNYLAVQKRNWLLQQRGKIKLPIDFHADHRCAIRSRKLKILTSYPLDDHLEWQGYL